MRLSYLYKENSFTGMALNHRWKILNQPRNMSFYWKFRFMEHISSICIWFMLCYALLWYSYLFKLHHWHWDTHMIAPMSVNQSWRIRVNQSPTWIQWLLVNLIYHNIKKNNKPSLFYGMYYLTIIISEQGAWFNIKYKKSHCGDRMGSYDCVISTYILV